MSSPNYSPSITIPTQTPSSSGSGILNFSVALGGILFVTIITGIIVYLYRKKIQCRQKMNTSTKGNNSNNGHFSCIMDYYANDYVLNPKKGIRGAFDGKPISKNDAYESVITSDVTNDTTIKTHKSLKSHISEFYSKNSSKIINLNRSKSEMVRPDKSKNDVIDNQRSKSTKSVKSSLISTSNDKNKISSEYKIPQISSPISMPSASIYDIERANNLADSLSRSTAFQYQSPPAPPLQVYTSSISDKQPKEVERNSQPKSRNARETSSISKLHSFYNLIPLIFMDSETTTTTTTEASPNVNNKIGADSPSPTIPQHKVTIAPPVGAIPDWSKAPWHDDLNFNNNYNNYNNNNNYNNYNNYNYDNYDNYYNYYNDNNYDNDDDNNSSEKSPRQSEDLIRFSNGSKYLINNSLNPNSESSEPEFPKGKIRDKINVDFVKELKSNIEKNPEKFEFLKNPAENHDNWKKNGNFFEYRLQRSKTII